MTPQNFFRMDTYDWINAHANGTHLQPVSESRTDM